MTDWIARADTLTTWIDARKSQALISLDTEFMRVNTFFPRLALIQIQVDDSIALLDATALDDFSSLAKHLSDPAVTSVMHSASEDIETLTTLLPDGPATLFDTQIAAAMAGFGPGLSYQKLVALLLGIDLPKAETRSDWLQRPLSSEQLEYAAQDVAYLSQLHDLLTEKLEALGRSTWLAEDCQRMIERICHTEPDLQPQCYFHGAANWAPEQQARLRRVLLWRETTARALDKPRPWLLDDAHALNLAATPPRDREELFQRSKGLRALRGPQREELLILLQMPMTPADLDLPPIAMPLNNVQKRALATMKESIDEIAIQHNLPAGLLCARRHLEALIADRAWPEALEGWRKPLLHDTLIAQLPEI